MLGEPLLATWSNKSDVVYFPFFSLFLFLICQMPYGKCNCFWHVLMVTTQFTLSNFSSSMQLTDITGLTYQLTLCESSLPTLFISRSPSLIYHHYIIWLHSYFHHWFDTCIISATVFLMQMRQNVIWLGIQECVSPHVLENFIIHI